MRAQQEQDQEQELEEEHSPVRNESIIEDGGEGVEGGEGASPT